MDRLPSQIERKKSVSSPVIYTPKLSVAVPPSCIARDMTIDEVYNLLRKAYPLALHHYMVF